METNGVFRPVGLARTKKLATVVRLRESMPKPEPTPEPAPVAAIKRGKTAASGLQDSRPFTQSSVYSDMTAMSGSVSPPSPLRQQWRACIVIFF